MNGPIPMLASPTSPASRRTGTDLGRLLAGGGWIADTKLDGIRALLHVDEQVRITNRIGRDITDRYPDVVAWAAEHLTGPVLLDGEIVAASGRFEDALTRDKQASPRSIAHGVHQRPVVFIAFDAPEVPGDWDHRRAALEQLAAQTGLTITPVSDDPGFLARTREMGLEGVVAKRRSSAYVWGKRSRAWLKFKNRYRVTCLVAGYTPGSGQRAHFGAMELALLDEAGTATSVGRVGTGFTEAKIAELKTALDSGTIMVVEVECLGVTSGGALRQPVFVDRRLDVTPSECTTAQLQHVPTC